MLKNQSQSSVLQKKVTTFALKKYLNNLTYIPLFNPGYQRKKGIKIT